MARRSRRVIREYRAEFGRADRVAAALLKPADWVGLVYAGGLTRTWRVGSPAATVERAVTSISEEIDRQRLMNFGLLPFMLLMMATVLTWRGKWPESERYYQEAPPTNRSKHGPYVHLCAAARARQFGDPAAVEERLSVDVAARTGVDNTVGKWEQLLNIVEGRAILGERDAAAGLYPVFLEGSDTGVVMTRYNRSPVPWPPAASTGVPPRSTKRPP